MFTIAIRFRDQWKDVETFDNITDARKRLAAYLEPDPQDWRPSGLTDSYIALRGTVEIAICQTGE